jgi:hypothetical protein
MCSATMARFVETAAQGFLFVILVGLFMTLVFGL